MLQKEQTYASQLTDTNAKLANEMENHQFAEAERVRLLDEQTKLQQEVIEAQQQAIKELSTPVIPIIDITGVTVVDTGVANYLNKTIQAARLKGARVIVTGISDAVAETIVELGIDWSNIETLRDLQSGLAVALDRSLQYT